MGLDAYIEKRKKDKEGTEITEEVLYMRKDWDILRLIDYDQDDYGRLRYLDKDTIRQIRDWYVDNPDYFGSFTKVETLCELYYNYDELIEEGWRITFCADW